GRAARGPTALARSAGHFGEAQGDIRLEVAMLCLACALHDDTVGGGLFGKDPCRKAAQGAQHELFELLLQVSGAVAGWKGGAVYPNRSAPSPGLAGVVCSSAVRRLRCPAGLPLLAL